MTSSNVIDIIESSQKLDVPIRVQGSQTLSHALVVDSWIKKTQTQTVITCPSDDAARELFDDLIELKAPVFLVPTWNYSPYSSISPSLESRYLRLRALSAAVSTEPALFITTELGLLQRTLPKELFQKKSLTLTVGQKVANRHEWTKNLFDRGYQKVDLVEDPGTFSVRGEILDLFSPQHEKPLRIEFFDETIERIRFYDRTTQKSLPSDSVVKSVLIIPAREFIISSDNKHKIRSLAKERADALGISKKSRDPVLDQIESGFYPDHSDFWCAYAYDESACFTHYLNSNHKIICVDELGCKNQFDQFIDELKRAEASLSDQNLISPTPGELYLFEGHTRPNIEKNTKLYFDSVLLSQPGYLEAEEPDPEITKNIKQHHRIVIDFSLNGVEEFFEKLSGWIKFSWTVKIACRTESSLQRIQHLLSERGINFQSISFEISRYSSSLRWPAEKLAILRDEDLLGTKKIKSTLARSTDRAVSDWIGLKSLSDLSVDDTIVHLDHGIGVYRGLIRFGSNDSISEFLILEYHGKDKLYLPVHRLHLIQKYHGGPDSVSLDRLGTNHFEKTKQKVKDSLRKMAIDLVDLYAKRSLQRGETFLGVDEQYMQFEDSFPFEETKDQLKAIDDCIEDLTTGKLMDRLVCGDVGFGKTEVAMRAAFLAVHSGKQVAVLVPTTVLCHQHENSFRNRMKNTPIKIASLSRFKSKQEQKTTLSDSKEGKVDIVIGTHRLLSKDVGFKDLGLVIIDEEHRFGVEHKEKLKALKLNTHFLTLTATPIPRTLQMSLSGLRDISAMTTPPLDRLPIRTYLSRYDEELIKKAILFELARGGQVFFVHNRVDTIFEIANRIKELVPESTAGVGHAQMAPEELEQVMLDFFEKKTNVLVCTTIIESGLDVSSANTIIINRADSFGLAQLYQLRGRVGRSTSRAYAYLLVPSPETLTSEAKQRLDVIQRFIDLGSGFNIASYDLEIRGGGNLLGAEQSGHIAAVGFELYTQLLEEAIIELKASPGHVIPVSAVEPEIKIPFSAYLDESYIPDVHQRLTLYRRISSAKTDAALQQIEEELRDRYGNLPPEAVNLLWVVRLKHLLIKYGLDSLVASKEKITLGPGMSSKLSPGKIVTLMQSKSGDIKITPDSKLIVNFPTVSPQRLYFHIEDTLKPLIH
ncbi:MAG: transcription-repair coupling factor [Xanthomonadaceae bacterium]|nr:transcription-repair coupling factor [Xanthomonadaceae bacterium]